MGLEASEVAVRVRLLGGTAFEREAQGAAKSIEEIGAAGKKADLAQSLGGGAVAAGAKVKTLEDRLGSFGKKLQGIGYGLAPVSAGLAFLGYTAVKTQAQFQSLMMQLVTQANLPRKQLQGLTKDVLALSTAVGQTPTALAGGLFQIVSSGVHNTARAMQLLKTTGVMASVGGDTVESSASALMSIYNSRIPGARNPSQIAAFIEAAIGQGKFHMEDINQSITSGILPMAKRLGMGIPDLFASLAALAREGVPPSQFMSRMRLTLTSVSAPTNAALKAFQQLGLQPGELAADLHKPGHLLTMLDDLQMHAARLKGGPRGALANALIASIFGKSRGMGNIAGLLDTLPQMQQIYGAVLGSTPGLLSTHFGETKTTDAFKIAQAHAAFQRSMINLGQVIDKYIIPDLTTLAMWLSKIISGFGKLPPGLQKFAIFLGAALVVLSPLAIALGGLFRAVGTMIGGVRSAVTWIQILGTDTQIAGGEIAAGGRMAQGGMVAFGKGLLRLIPMVALLGVALAALPTIKHQAHAYAHAFHQLGSSGGRHALATQGVKNYVTGHVGFTGPGLIGTQSQGFLGKALGFLGSISPFARGGVTRPGGISLVGEEGPELLTLPGGSRITPLPGNALSDIRSQFGNGGVINITVQTVLDRKVIAESVATVNRHQQNRK